MKVLSQRILLEGNKDSVTVIYPSGKSVSLYVNHRQKDSEELIYDNGAGGEFGYKLKAKLRKFELYL